MEIVTGGLLLMASAKELPGSFFYNSVKLTYLTQLGRVHFNQLFSFERLGFNKLNVNRYFEITFKIRRLAKFKLLLTVTHYFNQNVKI